MKMAQNFSSAFTLKNQSTLENCYSENLVPHGEPGFPLELSGPQCRHLAYHNLSVTVTGISPKLVWKKDADKFGAQGC